MDVDSALGGMREQGYKATPQRMEVVTALAAEQHQSLEEIRDRCPSAHNASLPKIIIT